jgi:hypothetical protein
MTLAQLHAYLEVARIVFEIAAIIAAGIWALYSFRVLNETARARGEMAKLDVEQKKGEAELRRLTEETFVGAVVDITMTAEQVALPGDQRRYICAEVTINNKGNRNAQLEYPEFPFTVFAVKPQADGTFEYVQHSVAKVAAGSAPNYKSLRMLVRAGGVGHIPFFVSVGAPGLYFLVFSTPVSEAEQAVSKRFGFQSGGKWSAKKYFVVT